MDRIQRVGERLPRFYRSWDRSSLIFRFITALCKELDLTEAEVTNMMKAHWVDTASGDELDRLGTLIGARRIPGEDDARFRTRLKRTVSEYEGGGTVIAIEDAIRALLGSSDPMDVRIVENPPAEASEEFRVMAGNTWVIGSHSIRDETPRITLLVEEGGEVRDPQIVNLDTGEGIVFKGTLSGGDRLVISEEGAFLNDKDVTSSLLAIGAPPTKKSNSNSNSSSSLRFPRLLRRGSPWRYGEALSMLLGVFDEARFDEHTFAVGVPFVRVRFDWMRIQPATFEVQIDSEALRKSGLTADYIGRFVESMKAAGVRATVRIMNRNLEGRGESYGEV
ncbi:hypothetical protein KEJ19_06435 [Candidatus Bathyarchaeota archaeon]|nr:hypothetical protein [Candidatus Bathyarchaeota archaeon]